MADAVQAALESFVPALRDALRKKIYTDTEAKAIVKKRTDFEYATRRRGAILADFLKYIDYEWSLDKIRRKRVGRLGREYKASLCDFAGAKQIHNLFNRAVQKFPGNVDLWLQYIGAAKKLKSFRRLGAIFARALQLHPHHTGLWVLAAAWEWETQANAASARKLMQRAVHLNRDQWQLWAEWFKMECMYVTKIRARVDVLQRLAQEATGAADKGEGSVADADEALEAEADAEDAMDVDGDSDTAASLAALANDDDQDDRDAALTAALTSAERAAADADALNPSSASAVQSDPVVQYAIPRLVYDEACRAHPSNVDLRRACLRVACASHGAEQLAEYVAREVLQTAARASAQALALALAYQVTPGVGALAASDPRFPGELHAALERLDGALADAQWGRVHAELRDEIIKLLDVLFPMASAADADLKAYVRAQMARHVLAYCKHLGGPELAKCISDDDTDLSNVGEGSTSLPRPLLPSTWELVAAQLPRIMDNAPAGVTRESVLRAATRQWPANVRLAELRLSVDPQWALQVLDGFERAVDVAAVLCKVHALVREGKLTFGASDEDSAPMVATRTADHAFAQWRHVARAQFAPAEVDAVSSAQAALRGSLVATLPAGPQRTALVERFLATVPVTALDWLASIVDALPTESAADRALCRKVYHLGAARWPQSVGWWLRYLRFEVHVAKDVAAGTQLYL